MRDWPEKKVERCFTDAMIAESLLTEADRLIRERADNDRDLLKVLVQIKCEKVYLLAGCKSFREYVDVRLRKSYAWARRHLSVVAAENCVSSAKMRLTDGKCQDGQLSATSSTKVPNLTFAQIEVVAKINPLEQHKAAETALKECQGMTPKATEAHLSQKYAKANGKAPKVVKSTKAPVAEPDVFRVIDLTKALESAIAYFRQAIKLSPEELVKAASSLPDYCRRVVKEVKRLRT